MEEGEEEKEGCEGARWGLRGNGRGEGVMCNIVIFLGWGSVDGAFGFVDAWLLGRGCAR